MGITLVHVAHAITAFCGFRNGPCNLPGVCGPWVSGVKSLSRNNFAICILFPTLQIHTKRIRKRIAIIG
jgi:hypothetical protein